MKKLFVALSLLVVSAVSYASPLGTETPIRSYGTPTTVSVSTSTWTKVPTSQTLDGQTGLVVSNPASANAVMAGHLGSCTSTAIATSVRPLEIPKGGFVLVPVSDSVCLYVLSLHTSAESIHVQEIKQ